MLTVLIVVGSIFGYGSMAGVSVRVIARGDAPTDGALVAGVFWPLTLPAVVGYRMLDFALFTLGEKRPKHQLPSARTHKDG
jgi:hypothetical protein